MDCRVCGYKCVAFNSQIMEICSSCRDDLGYTICDDCGNTSIEPNDPSACIFCSNPKAGHYYQVWLSNHPSAQQVVFPSICDSNGGCSNCSGCNKSAEIKPKMRNVVDEILDNDYTCPHCGNKRLNKIETVCWSCGWKMC